MELLDRDIKLTKQSVLASLHMWVTTKVDFLHTIGNSLAAPKPL